MTVTNKYINLNYQSIQFASKTVAHTWNCKNLIGYVAAYARYVNFFLGKSFQNLKFGLIQEIMAHVYEIKSPVGLVTQSILDRYNGRAPRFW